MRGVLLESGKVDRYLQLGKSGYPVFDSASQILAVLQRHKQLLPFFGVPQRNEQGSVIDWYSPVQGPVIAWANASDEERAQALESLKTCSDAVTAHGAKLVAEGQQKGASNIVLVGELLQEACKIPRLDNIYLVDSPQASSPNGLQPVMTFWGFVENEHDRHSKPLYFFEQKASAPAPIPEAPQPTPAVAAPAVAAAPVAPPAAPAVAAPTVAAVPPVVPVVPVVPVAPVVVAQPWWRRWWFWLGLVLLGVLLLWLLRACMPVGGAVVGLPSVPVSSVSLPSVSVPNASLPSAPMPAVPAVTGVPSLAGAAPEPMNPAVVSAAVAPQDSAQSAVLASPPALEAAPELPAEAPAAPEAPASMPVPQLPAEQAQSPQPPLLEVPANAPEGVADFLNGKYRTRGGLMDEQSSLPLNLHYEFEKGKGKVQVTRSNGVTCSGDVLATVSGGQLGINSQGAATCTDGGSYVMPAVHCKTGASSMAECAGSYGATQQIPMQMHRN